VQSAQTTNYHHTRYLEWQMVQENARETAHGLGMLPVDTPTAVANDIHSAS
jgi:hypothetical protein